MKKSFVKLLLSGAMVLAGFAFVGCNDLVDEMEGVKAQATQNATDIAAIKTQITALEQGIAAAEQAAAEAKTYAEQCAATAKKEALAEAKTYAEELVANATEVTEAEFAKLYGMIEGIDKTLVTLDASVKKNAEDIAANAAAIAKINEQIKALELFKKEAEADIDSIIKDLEAIKKDIEDNEKAIEDVQDQLDAVKEDIEAINEDLVTLENLIYSVLKSVAYVPSKIDTVLNEIEDGFKSIMRCTETDCSTYEYVSSNCVVFNYRVNPADAEVKKEELSFIAIDVETRAADQKDVFEVVDMKRDGDRIAVTVKSKTDIPGDNKTGLDGKKAKLVALKVANDNYSIVSDYTAVADEDLKNYSIRNKVNKAKFFNVHWHKAFAASDVKTATDFYDDKAINRDPANGDIIIPVELVHNSEVNLLDYVETYCTELNSTLDAAACMKPEYVFSTPETYKSPVDADTDQQDFVVLDGSKLSVEFNGELANVNQNSTIVAVGKTPVVEVVAKVAGKAIAKAFIKVDIVEEPTKDPIAKDPITITFPEKTYKYNELTDKDLVAPANFAWTATSSDYVTWSQLTSKVLANQGVVMSNEMFEQVYYFDADGNPVTPTHSVTTSVGNVNGVDFNTDPNAATATTTTYVGYALNSLVKENCKATVTITFKSKDVYTYPDLKLEFPFAVTHTTVLPVLTDEYSANNLVEVKGHSNPTATAFEWTYEIFLHEAFKYDTYNVGCQSNANHSALAFELAANAPAAAVLFTDASMNYTPVTDDWQTVKMTLNLKGANATFDTDVLYNHDEANAGVLRTTVDDLVWAANGYLDVPVVLYTVLDNGNKCKFNYTVRFVNPFAVTLNNVVLETSSVGTTYDMLKKDITITFQGKPVYENNAYTQLADDLKLVGHLGHEFSIIGKTINEEIAKGTNDYGYPTSSDSKKWLHWTDLGMIYWNNGGTVLQKDVPVDATVYGFCDQIGWFTLAKPATVTLQNNK